ncbi:MAG: hypothetical protein JXQ90_12885 [Cyclobacteriaceae bacterium]
MKKRKINEAFVKQYKPVFADQLIQQAYQHKTYLTGKDILSLTSIKQLNFFILKTLFTLWQEEMKRMESPYFDYQHADVRKGMVHLMNTLSMHIKVDANDLKPLIEQALDETLKLALTPAEYLEDQLSKKGVQKITPNLARQLIKYLVMYKDLFDEFLSSVYDKPFDEVIRQGHQFFEDAPVDLEELTNQLSSVLILNPHDMLDPVFENPVIEKKVPVFHYEPKEDGIVNEEEAVEERTEEEPKEDLASDTLASEEFYEPVAPDLTSEDEPVSDEVQDYEEELQEENEPESSEQEEESLDDESQREEHEEEIDEEPEPEEPEMEEPEEESTVTSEEQVYENKVGIQEIVKDEEAQPEVETLNSQFEVETKTLADLHEEKKVNNIMEAISINHRYMFLQELFDGDNEEFQNAINTIEGCSTFDEAVEMLVQKYAKDFYWEMNSDEVKEFLKVVFRRFRD